MLHYSGHKSSVPHSFKASVTRALTTELSNLQYLIDHLPDTTDAFIHSILTTKGKIVFSGFGKSGLIAKKLASTFSSLGIASLFIHPGDALHGDLGMIQANDLFVTLSKSASGEEFEKIFASLSSFGNRIALISCTPGPLSSKADIVVQLPFLSEACHLKLAPTSSTTIMVAFGDAVAIAIAQERNFTKEDFAQFHPAGSLGKNLLLTVQDFMYKKEQLPFLSEQATFQDILLTITQKKLGIGIVATPSNALLGIITDGDLRRACNQGVEVFNKKAYEIMTTSPKTIPPYMLAKDALIYMEEFSITTLVIVDETTVIGIVHIHDLIKAGIKG